MSISYHQHFIKAYKKLSQKLQQVTDDKIRIFRREPSQRELNNHKLHGKWEGYRSINITGDYRAIFCISEDQHVIFSLVGTHHQLYGS